jgi:hypothetical protein
MSSVEFANYSKKLPGASTSGGATQSKEAVFSNPTRTLSRSGFIATTSRRALIAITSEI